MEISRRFTGEIREGMIEIFLEWGDIMVIVSFTGKILED